MAKFLGGVFGVVNAVAGLSLLFLGFVLPSHQLVDEWTTRVNSVVATAADQVRLVRDSLDDFKAEELATATTAIADATEQAALMAQATTVDFEAVEQATAAMAGTASAIEAMDPVLRVAYLKKVRGELEAVATALDRQAAPAAKAASLTLGEIGERAEQQAKKFAEVLKAADLDASAVSDIAESLESFANAINGAEQLMEALSKDLPSLVSNLKNIANDCRKYKKSWLVWGAGDDVKSGLTEAAAGLDSVAKILTKLDAELFPSITEAMSSSHGVMKKVAGAGRHLTDHRDQVDKLLKDSPELIVGLGTEIGKFGKRLSEMMAETGRITAVADALRASAEQLSEVESALPAVRKAVAGSASVIRVAQKNMTALTGDREAFNGLGQRTGRALKAATEALGRVNEKLVARVDRQKLILQQVEANCSDMQLVLPAANTAASSTLLALRLFAFSYGVSLLVHGVRQVVSVRRSPL